MSDRFVVAAAQLGPVPVGAPRAEAVSRLIDLLRTGAARRARLVVFPELALTPFFPRWLIESPAELDPYFEKEMPSPVVRPLFDEAARLNVGFYLGYAELTPSGERFNSAVLVSPAGLIVGKYRKIHLPGRPEPVPGQPFQNLEKRYFQVGDLGFRVWPMLGTLVGACICNDRRWCETYRVLSLRGAEVIVLGYSTTQHAPNFPEFDVYTEEHNHLSMRAGAYQNAAWVVGSAKAGVEEGVAQIGGSCIVAPSGEIVAAATTLDDELVLGEIDLELARRTRRTLDFTANRRPEYYREIVAGTPDPDPVR